MKLRKGHERENSEREENELENYGHQLRRPTEYSSNGRVKTPHMNSFDKNTLTLLFFKPVAEPVT